VAAAERRQLFQWAVFTSADSASTVLSSPERQVIALETAHENLYAAVKKGSKQTKRAVRRHLRKSHRIQKQRIRDHLHDTDIAAAIWN